MSPREERPPPSPRCSGAHPSMNSNTAQSSPVSENMDLSTIYVPFGPPPTPFDSSIPIDNPVVATDDPDAKQDRPAHWTRCFARDVPRLLRHVEPGQQIHISTDGVPKDGPEWMVIGVDTERRIHYTYYRLFAPPGDSTEAGPSTASAMPNHRPSAVPSAATAWPSTAPAPESCRPAPYAGFPPIAHANGSHQPSPTQARASTAPVTGNRRPPVTDVGPSTASAAVHGYPPLSWPENRHVVAMFNLPPHITEEELREIIGTFMDRETEEDIRRIVILGRPRPFPRRAEVFIEFGTERSARAVLCEFDGFHWDSDDMTRASPTRYASTVAYNTATAVDDQRMQMAECALRLEEYTRQLQEAQRRLEEARGHLAANEDDLSSHEELLDHALLQMRPGYDVHHPWELEELLQQDSIADLMDFFADRGEEISRVTARLMITRTWCGLTSSTQTARKSPQPWPETTLSPPPPPPPPPPRRRFPRAKIRPDRPIDGRTLPWRSEGGPVDDPWNAPALNSVVRPGWTSSADSAAAAAQDQDRLTKDKGKSTAVAIKNGNMDVGSILCFPSVQPESLGSGKTSNELMADNHKAVATALQEIKARTNLGAYNATGPSSPQGVWWRSLSPGPGRNVSPEPRPGQVTPPGKSPKVVPSGNKRAAAESTPGWHSPVPILSRTSSYCSSVTAVHDELSGEADQQTFEASQPVLGTRRCVDVADSGTTEANRPTREACSLAGMAHRDVPAAGSLSVCMSLPYDLEADWVMQDREESDDEHIGGGVLDV